MTTLVLRDYQRQAVDSVFDYFERRKGNPIVCMPTGSGKSPTMAALMAEAIKLYPSTRILSVTHRKELIEQNADEFAKFFPEYAPVLGVNSAGIGRRDYNKQIVFCGIQTVHKTAEKFGHVDLVIVDECHLIPHNNMGMYRKFIERLSHDNPYLKMIGFTATPYRADSGLLTCGDDKIFSSVCHNVDVAKLIDDGYLSSVKSKQSKTTYNLKNLKSKGGEYLLKYLQERVDESEDVTEEAIRECFHDAQERASWIVFCASITQAHLVTAMLRGYMMQAEIITGVTQKSKRAHIIEQFKKKKIQAIVNVDILTTGFNAPNVDFIAILRPTKSVGLYVQMVGRGLRKAEGKVDCLVYDFGENIKRHGPLNQIRIPKPTKQGDGDGALTKCCPSCFYEHVPLAVMICPECEHEFVPDVEPKIRKRACSKQIIMPKQNQWVKITRVEYNVHRKKDKPPSMRVTYYGGHVRAAHEWVCPEHGGWAAQKAQGWFIRRLKRDTDFPAVTAEAAVDAGRAGEYLEPTEILIDANQGSRAVTSVYPKIVTYKFPEVENASNPETAD